ncbi:MAG: hypothetical protein EON88_26065 [Brevundimonas sp.]|nr:MAG: hypothetical protein EON88_26065 [Brevundimonas sp.]
MADLKTVLSEAVAAAFAAEGVDAALARVTPSDRPDLADFQSNGALAAAKAPFDWKSARSGRSDGVTRARAASTPSAAKAAATASLRTVFRSDIIGSVRKQARAWPAWCRR